MQKDEMNAQQALLDWCHQNLKGYDSVRVKDFSSSWRDGKALIAILNRHRPDKISFNDSYLRSNLENLRTAFEFSENEFGVTKILDPEDVDTDHPDEKSIMTYVSMLFNSIPSIPMHPTEIQLESQKKQLMEEYSSICKSLMRWLRDSISTMDNRTVPKSLFEVK
ncbi:microtubule-actin cross-linking factor 1-like isoform X13, partial [Brachionus plicatilis]